MKTATLFLSTALGLQAQTVSIGNTNDWIGGYRVEYQVENNGSEETEGWLVILDLGAGRSPSSESNAQQVAALSNPAAGIFAFTNEDYNSTIASGGSQTFGFNVDPDNDTTPPDTGQVTLNYDPGSLPAFQIADVAVLEGDDSTGTVELTVQLSVAATEEATVDFTTVNGTATAGSDFTANSGTLVFAAGETQKTITVALLGDLIDEGNEAFTVVLSNPTVAALTDASATVTITENDVVPDLAIADSSGFENGGTPMQFIVTLTPSSTDTITVNYATGGGSATAGSDYTATSGLLIFAPGENSKTFSVDVLDDGLEELPEVFQVTLSGQTNADLGRAIAAGTILDDELSGSGKPETGEFNYAEVLQKSMYFYEAQRSGDLPESNRVHWRADSALTDGGDVGRDLTGGWYDAGDHVKFGFPMANSATILAWGGLDFQDAYLETGQYPFLLDNLRWVCDYFLKCHQVDAEGKTETFWGQVGNGGVDHSYWGPPELYPLARPSYKIDRANPGTDLACETAAALASCSILFRPTDPAYADRLLENARALNEFGNTYLGKYSDSISDASGFYNSFSGYEDERLWAALWLHRATGEQAYLSAATDFFNAKFPGGGDGGLVFAPSWDDKNYGSVVMMAQVYKTDLANPVGARARELARIWLNKWYDGTLGGDFTVTEGGLRWLIPWGSLRYAANTSMLAFLYAKEIEDPEGHFQELGEIQLNYILGKNPQNQSYVIGFGDDFPTHPHHRSAHGGWQNSGPEEDANGDQFPSRNILYGGLVGGPIEGSDDGWLSQEFKRDGSTAAFQANEVATDYNSGFTACAARMYELYGGSPLSDFPPAAAIPEGTEIFVSAAVTSNESRFTQVRCLVNNRSYAPAREGKDVAFRYYLDLSEVYAAGLTKDDLVIDFNPIVSGPAPTISEVLTHDEAERIYYLEIDLGEQNPIPIGRSPSQVEVQLRVGVPNSAPTSAWNPNNDFSFTSISSGASNTTYTGFIPTYQRGVLIDGMLPGGGTTPAFDLWQESVFTPAEQSDPQISGPLADPDGDGYSNIVEYAFNKNPKAQDQGPLYESALTPESGRAIFSFGVNPAATDVVIEVEGSDDLRELSWSDLTMSELPDSTATMKEIEVNFDRTKANYFFRLKVEQRNQ